VGFYPTSKSVSIPRPLCGGVVHYSTVRQDKDRISQFFSYPYAPNFSLA
jgi:hypothetical protein